MLIEGRNQGRVPPDVNFLSADRLRHPPYDLHHFESHPGSSRTFAGTGYRILAEQIGQRVGFTHPQASKPGEFRPRVRIRFPPGAHGLYQRLLQALMPAGGIFQ
jgi:hypothetical protein